MNTIKGLTIYKIVLVMRPGEERIVPLERSGSPVRIPPLVRTLPPLVRIDPLRTMEPPLMREDPVRVVPGITPELSPRERGIPVLMRAGEEIRVGAEITLVVMRPAGARPEVAMRPEGEPIRPVGSPIRPEVPIILVGAPIRPLEAAISPVEVPIRPTGPLAEMRPPCSAAVMRLPSGPTMVALPEGPSKIAPKIINNINQRWQN